jgi:hypothetical protein
MQAHRRTDRKTIMQTDTNTDGHALTLAGV